MDALTQVAIVANMTWWSVALAVAFWLYWQRGRIQQVQQVVEDSVSRVQYVMVDDYVSEEVMPGDVWRTIKKYEREGYEYKGLESHGVIQKLKFHGVIKRPIRNGQVG